MQSDISKLIAYKIKRLREERGLSQEKLAAESGLHRTYIGMIERCEKNVTVVSLEKIAKALNVDIIELVHE
ncbi:MAG: helix-turn-helix transcriptional regulator [Bacteroidaceae bacterium]|nr:helix-turn-helix transcriptional regulator [Bacteroidaceae bacterium]MBR3613345.1 helix-turn-helix transcriptional regulator [Bacteroidaceae bacterium]